jgi:uncharacterized protein (DUF1499 family)
MPRPGVSREVPVSRLGRFLPGLAVALAGLAGLGVLLAGPGYRVGWWSLGPAFALLRWGAELGLVATVVALVAVVVGVARHSGRRLGIGVLALAVALTAFGIPWRMQAQAHRVPPIHDVTTDPEDPPAFAAVIARRAGARNPVEYAGPAVAAQQRRAFPDLVPLDLAAPPDRVFPAVEAAARGLGWEIVAAVPGEGRLEATATTPWFGFKDDVVVRVRSRGSGSRVDVRSLSRIGVGDLGVNAARVRRFLDRLRASGLTRLDSAGPGGLKYPS